MCICEHLHVCMSISNVRGGQKREFDFLELELRAAMWTVGTEPSLLKGYKCS